ncbi:MAG: class I SAM-dependent methyltransferase [Candidatus Bilamarchaeaceae archaeon]
MSFKEDFILNAIKDKDVLDIGSGGDLVYLKEHADVNELLVYKMRKIAKSLTLVEIDRHASDKLKSLGFTVYNDNAEIIKINNTFDVIVMGDVIEHVDNIGLLIKNMKSHLRKDGKIIITTPNPFSFNNFFRILTFRKPNIQFDHTSFIEPNNLVEICKRNGLKLEELHYYTLTDKRSVALHVGSCILKIVGSIYQHFNLYWLAVLKKE